MWQSKDITYKCRLCGESHENTWFFNRDQKPDTCFSCISFQGRLEYGTDSNEYDDHFPDEG